MSLVEFQERKGIRGGLVNGVWYPSTSAILDGIHGSKVGFIDEADLDRGSRLHAHACGWAKAMQAGKKYDVAIEAEDCVQLIPLFDWLKRHVEEVYYSETTLYSAVFGYVGTPDFIGRLKELGQRSGCATIDFKFAESATDVRYLDQIESYVHLTAAARSSRLILQINKAGEIKTHWCRPRPAAWAAFINMATVLRYKATL